MGVPIGRVAGWMVGCFALRLLGINVNTKIVSMISCVFSSWLGLLVSLYFLFPHYKCMYMCVSCICIPHCVYLLWLICLHSLWAGPLDAIESQLHQLPSRTQFCLRTGNREYGWIDIMGMQRLDWRHEVALTYECAHENQIYHNRVWHKSFS